MPEPVRYQVGGRDAFRLNVEEDSDSSLSVEPYGSFTSVTWSTSLPIADILDRVAERLPDPEVGEAVLYDPSTRRHQHMSSADALRRLRDPRSDVPFARVQFGDVTLVWEKGWPPRESDHRAFPGRLGVHVQDFDGELLTGIVRATATAALGCRADEIVRDAEQLLNPPGDPDTGDDPGGR